MIRLVEEFIYWFAILLTIILNDSSGRLKFYPSDTLCRKSVVFFAFVYVLANCVPHLHFSGRQLITEPFFLSSI